LERPSIAGILDGRGGTRRVRTASSGADHGERAGAGSISNIDGGARAKKQAGQQSTLFLSRTPHVADARREQSSLRDRSFPSTSARCGCTTRSADRPEAHRPLPGLIASAAAVRAPRMSRAPSRAQGAPSHGQLNLNLRQLLRQDRARDQRGPPALDPTASSGLKCRRAIFRSVTRALKVIQNAAEVRGCRRNRGRASAPCRGEAAPVLDDLGNYDWPRMRPPCQTALREGDTPPGNSSLQHSTGE